MTKTTATVIFKIEGGIYGSMHHRGPWYVATEAEAIAACEGDAYAAKHPAATGISLDYSQVEVESRLLKRLSTLVSVQEKYGFIPNTEGLPRWATDTVDFEGEPKVIGSQIYWGGGEVLSDLAISLVEQ